MSFGDATIMPVKIGVDVRHAHTKPGFFSVKLTVSDKRGNMKRSETIASTAIHTQRLIANEYHSSRSPGLRWGLENGRSARQSSGSLSAIFSLG
ncbi:MAG: hypothetical protein CMJ89_04175 [Planctomycetes bacterium]|nr:hypothetical protein [Planctomycetota bacterium]